MSTAQSMTRTVFPLVLMSILGPPLMAEQDSIQLVETGAGIAFVHDSGSTGEFVYPEILCGGVCLADLDGDRDLDLYVPQAGSLETNSGSARPSNSLYLNDGSGQFRDASSEVGVITAGYGMGAFAADFDQDDDLDVLVTNAGALVLLSNNGNATFVDATKSAKIPQIHGLWMNAAWADFDQDGDLDVYVANYTNWQYDTAPTCQAPSGQPDYCNPKNYKGSPDLLLLSNGDGSFQDATASAGIDAAEARSMGVVCFDADGDQDLDIYVAYDGEANLLWINQGDGTFTEEALVRGAALNAAGMAEASMGIACGDFDADGDEDLILTHLAAETHTAYRNDGGFFVDVTAMSGIGRWSRPGTGFGIGMVDFNNDGALDLLVANGGVARPPRPKDPASPYAQPNQVVVGQRGGKFRNAQSLEAEGSIGHVTRGAAFGDLDGDGRIDAVLVDKDGPVRVYRNETENTGNWIGFRPVNRPGGSTTLNALIKIDPQGQRHFSAVVRPHSSYLSSSEEIVRFGLGAHDSPIQAEVTWPDGLTERFSNLACGSVHDLVRGKGMARSDNLRDEDVVLVAYHPPQEADGQSGGLPEFPKLVLKEIPGKRTKQVELDQQALDAWCKNAGLPDPPEVSALDAPSWVLVHQAIEAAGKEPTAQHLGELAMHYDGHRLEEAATELYRRAVKQAPYEARWLHLLGRSLLKQGDAEAAVSSLERARDVVPQHTGNLGVLAEAYMALGQPDRAATTWESYLKQLKGSPIGYSGLARAREAAGDLDGAMVAAKRALSKNPTARNTLVLAARVAGRQGDAEAASKYSDRASALTKADDLTLYDQFEVAMYTHAKPVPFLQLMANHKKAKGEYAEAYESAKLLAERRPDDPTSWQLLLWLATANNDEDGKEEYARVAVELDDSFAPGWETLGRFDVAAGRYQQGAQKAIKALKIDPNLAMAYQTLGLALGKLGRNEEAIKALDRWLQTNPKDLVALQMKGICLYKLNRLGETQQIVDTILAIQPRHAWALKMAEAIK